MVQYVNLLAIAHGECFLASALNCKDAQMCRMRPGPACPRPDEPDAKDARMCLPDVPRACVPTWVTPPRPGGYIRIAAQIYPCRGAYGRIYPYRGVWRGIYLLSGAMLSVLSTYCTVQAPGGGDRCLYDYIIAYRWVLSHFNLDAILRTALPPMVIALPLVLNTKSSISIKEGDSLQVGRLPFEGGHSFGNPLQACWECCEVPKEAKNTSPGPPGPYPKPVFTLPGPPELTLLAVQLFAWVLPHSVLKATHLPLTHGPWCPATL